MNAAKALVLVTGALGLVYGDFSYAKETHEADVGSYHMSIEDNKYIPIPIWAGIGAIAVGGLLHCCWRTTDGSWEVEIKPANTRLYSGQGITMFVSTQSYL